MWNQNVINFLVRQKFLSFIKYIYYTYLHIYVYRSFSITLDRGLRKNIKIKRQVGEHKQNEMGLLNMKEKKWNKLDKSKRSVVFKHEYSLETYLEIWKKKAIPEHMYFSKNSRRIRICIWTLKSDYRFFYEMVVLVI